MRRSDRSGAAQARPLLDSRRPAGLVRDRGRASSAPSTASRSPSTAARSWRSSASPARASRSRAMTLMGLTRGPNAQLRGAPRRSTARPGQRIPEASCSKIRGAGIAMVFQDPMSSLDPVYRVGNQIVEQIRAHEPRSPRPQAMDRAVELMERVGIPRARGAAALLPARVLRRHAPARDDRDGAVVLAQAADRRRADDRARRDDPGPDPRRAAPAARRRPAPGSSSSPTTSASSPTSPTGSS